MTAAIIIVAVALAKVLLAIMAARQGGALDSPSGESADCKEADAFVPGRSGSPFEDSPTGNLPSEEYSAAAGSRQISGDFRDSDDYCHLDSFDHGESPSTFDTPDG